jgi:uncharacterized protein (TIGR04255 family)
VIEAYCAIYFRDIMDMNAPHLGAFWEPLRGDFPYTETQPALPPLFMSNPLGMGALFQSPAMDFPRSWFLSEDKCILIQIQRDRLIVNWRKIDNATEYPSFETLKEKFNKIFESFKSSLATNRIGPIHLTGAEMGYVNNIITDECRLRDIIPALNPQLLLDDDGLDADTVNFGASFAFPNRQGALSMVINTIGPNVIRINLVSRWIADITEDAAREWLEYAHIKTVSAFAACTSEKMHAKWERVI